MESRGSFTFSVVEKHHLEGIAGSYGSTMFNMLRELLKSSKVAVTFYIPAKNVYEVQVFHLCQHLLCLFDCIYSI